MTQKEIIAGNKLIAEFMGAAIIERYSDHVLYDFISKDKYPSHLRYESSLLLKYHSSWDWLMPVVEKIESLGFDFCLIKNVAFIRREFDYWEDYRKSNKFESAWIAIVEFIQWYNKQHKGTES